MGGDLLECFLRHRAFFRIATICRELRCASTKIALQHKDTVWYAWRLSNAPAYHTRCKHCNQYVLKAQLLPPIQHVCAHPLPRWKVMLLQHGLLQAEEHYESGCCVLVH